MLTNSYSAPSLTLLHPIQRPSGSQLFCLPQLPFLYRFKAKRSMITAARLKWYEEVSSDARSYQKDLDEEIKILETKRNRLFQEEERRREVLRQWRQFQQQPQQRQPGQQPQPQQQQTPPQQPQPRRPPTSNSWNYQSMQPPPLVSASPQDLAATVAAASSLVLLQQQQPQQPLPKVLKLILVSTTVI